MCSIESRDWLHVGVMGSNKGAAAATDEILAGPYSDNAVLATFRKIAVFHAYFFDRH